MAEILAEQEEIIQVLFDKLISNCYALNDNHSFTHFDLEICFKTNVNSNYEIIVTECYSNTSEFVYNIKAISEAVNEKLERYYSTHKFAE
jgi:hypothetical protein